jgi:type IV pilus assembly protein PilE
MKDCNYRRQAASTLRGFTLIELMITCAIVAILSAIAFPSYQKHVQKSARASAKAQMMDLANREQQVLLANRSYTTTLPNYSLPSELTTKYTFSIATASTPPAFTITFAPINSQVSDGTLTLTSDGTKSPADKW